VTARSCQVSVRYLSGLPTSKRALFSAPTGVIEYRQLGDSYVDIPRVSDFHKRQESALRTEPSARSLSITACFVLIFE
jgi:hypothetical protein